MQKNQNRYASKGNKIVPEKKKAHIFCSMRIIPSIGTCGEKKLLKKRAEKTNRFSYPTIIIEFCPASQKMKCRSVLIMSFEHNEITHII